MGDAGEEAPTRWSSGAASCEARATTMTGGSVGGGVDGEGSEVRRLTATSAGKGAGARSRSGSGGDEGERETWGEEWVVG